MEQCICGLSTSTVSQILSTVFENTVFQPKLVESGDVKPMDTVYFGGEEGQKALYISGPAQFNPVLFKGQL